jgi:hypothetical protein
MADSQRWKVDMSSEAIDRRLREVASLYRLGISIGNARRLGRVENSDSTNERERPRRAN